MAQDDENSIYDTPQSSQDEEIPLALKLVQEQSMFGAIVGSLSAGIPSILIYALIVAMYNYPVVAYVLPGILIGLTSRFCGRGLYWRFRLVTGFITFVLLVVINYILTYPSGMVLSLPSVILAIILSKRQLTREENAAFIRFDALGR